MLTSKYSIQLTLRMEGSKFLQAEAFLEEKPSLSGGWGDSQTPPARGNASILQASVSSGLSIPVSLFF